MGLCLLLPQFKRIMIIVFFYFVSLGAIPCSAGQLQFTLESPDYKVAGHHGQQVLIQGYQSIGVSGAPKLPMASFWVVLPPDIKPETLSLSVLSRRTDRLAVPLDLAPVPPMGTADSANTVVAKKTIAREKRKSEVYMQDAFFPLSPIRMGNVSQLKGVNLVRITFTPIQYNPVTRQADWTRQLQFQLFFKSEEDQPVISVKNGLQALSLLTDPVLNEDSVKQWYFPEISKTYDYGPLSTSGNGYVIFTTDAIKSVLYDPASGVLKTFASHKLSLGYAVYLVTESQAITHSSGLSDPGFGSDTGQHRAVNIRTWLAANHGTSEKNIKYALFIGNPDPDDPTNGSDTFGDLPMLMCFTGYDSYGISITTVPTDYFFAELSGDWDLDRDGLYGEFNGDNGTGGVEFLPEVYVGRIPFSDTSRISGILQKTMDYENVTFSATDNSALAWRKKTLLPMSILNFGTSMWGGCSGDGSEITDEAYLGRSAEIHLLHPNGFDTFMMTEQDGDPTHSITISPIPGDGRMAEGIKTYWNNLSSFGVVMWSVHGSSTYVSRKYYPDSTYCPRFSSVFSAFDTNDLDDDFPAFIVSTSCNIGYPENSGNLAHELMENGAITAVAGSRTLLYVEGDFSKDYNNFAPMDIGSRDLRATAYYYTQGLSNDLPAGDALFIAKQAKYINHQAAWVNNFGMNLYGDPALKLLPPSFSSLDSDGDGLSDDEERYIYQSVPTLPDSDGDGLDDGDELVKLEGKWIGDYDGDGLNTLQDRDSDDDGLWDGVEVDQTYTNPFKADSDDDGLTDFYEVNQDGDPSNYMAAVDFDPNNPDTDADGVNDGDELAASQNPLDPWDNKATAVAGPDISLDAQAGGVTIVSLDGSGSSDPNNDPLFYFWNVENTLSESYTGYYIQPHDSTAASTPTLYAPVGGDYIITLKVREDDINNYVWSELDTLTVHIQHKILAISPKTYSWGETVTLGGLGFDKDPLQNTVTFGNVLAQVTEAAYDELQVVVPDGASAGDIVVKVNDKLSNPFPSGLTLQPGAFYPAPPDSLPGVLNCSQAAAMGDIDGDGDIDIVVANMGSDPDKPYDDPVCGSMNPQNRLFLNVGSGMFTDATFGIDGIQGTSDDRLPLDADQSVDIKLVDLDGDGDLDMVVANVGNIFSQEQQIGMEIIYTCAGTGEQNRLYINNGAGFFTDETQIRLPADLDASTGVAIGDINGDTFPDLIFSNSNECVPETDFWPVQEVCCEYCSECSWCICCDDCADCPDNLGCQPHDIPVPAMDRIFVNDGNGSFTDMTEISIPGYNKNYSVTNGLSLADMDGDGDLDMVRNAAWGSYYGIYLFDNNGGVFSQAGNRLMNDGNGKNILLADFDKEPGSLTDIFISHPDGYYPTYLINLGNGDFENHSHYYSSDDWLPPDLTYSGDYIYGEAGLAIDADLDGDLDVVIGRSHDSSNRLLINDDGAIGHFIHTPGLLPALLESTYGIAKGDVNNDGSPDLFFANTGRNTLLLNAISVVPPCPFDFDEDNDIDGQDLFEFIGNGVWIDLDQFVDEFGGNCGI